MKSVKFKIKTEQLLPALLMSPSALAALFRRAVAQAEQATQDYHLMVCSNVAGTRSVLKCKTPRAGRSDCPRGGPCSSCDPSLSLQTLLMAPRAAGLTELSNSLLLVHQGGASMLWLDAKDRAMLVLTPRTHKERLSQLDEEELAQAFEDLRTVLQRHEGLAGSVTRLVLNQGRCQNHPHLHWKLYMERDAFERFVGQLPQQQQRDRETVMRAVREARQAGQLGRKP